MTVYVVGFHPDAETGSDKWGIVGIFTDSQTAEAECKDWRYWVAPIDLNKSTGDEPIVWPNQSMPNKSAEAVQ